MALAVFKTVRDLTASGWVGSIPMHSRHIYRKGMRIRSFVALALLVAAAVPGAAGAQIRTDTVRTIPAALPSLGISIRNDSLQPPLTPRRAFFYSFLVPGYSQAKLGRNKAGAAFVLVEAISLAMIRESAADLHEAKRLRNDSIVVSYNGSAPVMGPPTFGDAEVKTRRAHVEDWAALLVANHLFSGADAFVAAHLWDVKARLSLQAAPNGATYTGLSLTLPLNLP